MGGRQHEVSEAHTHASSPPPLDAIALVSSRGQLAVVAAYSCEHDVYQRLNGNNKRQGPLHLCEYTLVHPADFVPYAVQSAPCTPHRVCQRGSTRALLASNKIRSYLLYASALCTTYGPTGNGSSMDLRIQRGYLGFRGTRSSLLGDNFLQAGEGKTCNLPKHTKKDCDKITIHENVTLRFAEALWRWEGGLVLEHTPV